MLIGQGLWGVFQQSWSLVIRVSTGHIRDTEVVQNLTNFQEANDGSLVNLCSVEMIVKTQAHKLCFQPIVVGAAFLRARPRHETTLYRGAARKNCDEQSSGQCWAWAVLKGRKSKESTKYLVHSSSSTRSDLLKPACSTSNMEETSDFTSNIEDALSEHHETNIE